jgi:hypothetical protein
MSTETLLKRDLFVMHSFSEHIGHLLYARHCAKALGSKRKSKSSSQKRSLLKGLLTLPVRLGMLFLLGSFRIAFCRLYNNFKSSEVLSKNANSCLPYMHPPPSLT